MYAEAIKEKAIEALLNEPKNICSLCQYLMEPEEKADREKLSICKSCVKKANHIMKNIER